jgi:hypothetical protein
MKTVSIILSITCKIISPYPSAPAVGLLLTLLSRWHSLAVAAIWPAKWRTMTTVGFIFRISLIGVSATALACA